MQTPLTLDIGINRWTYYSIRAMDPKFAPIANQIHHRDDFTCRYCSFRAFEYMNVVNANKNYLDNSIKNLMTACPLCTQCLFIEMAGKNGLGGGQLIYLPEISQNDLNGLCHALFCAMAMKSASQEKASQIFDSLKLRAQTIEQQWGTGLSDPNFMGQMIIDAPTGDIDKTCNEFLSSLRLLPSYEGFAMTVETWIKSSANRASRAL